MSVPPAILVVEDNEEIRTFLKIALETRGYHVEIVQDAGEAIQAVGVRHFDLAIIDLQLPDMTGIQLGQTIRQRTELAVIPMVLFSGSFTKALEKEAFSVGFSRYLVKPVPIMTLYQVIDELIK